MEPSKRTGKRKVSDAVFEQWERNGKGRDGVHLPVVWIRLLVWCVAVLVQEAVSGVVLVSDEDCSSCSNFLQGRNGERWVQLACKM